MKNMRFRFKGCLLVLLTGFMVFAGLLYLAHQANRAPVLPVPPEVVKRTERLTLQGREVLVDVYLPAGVAGAPVVIVAHGFSRSRRVMAGWGILLARQGICAVVPSLPFFADHGGNAQAVRELVRRVHEGGLWETPVLKGGVGLLGHSAGGFSTWMAAAGNAEVRCWAGLDPVDFLGQARAAASGVKVSALMLLAEPGAWNLHANALPWLEHAGANLTALRVRGSTHCDPEHPTTLAAELVSGRTEAKRRAVYERHVLAHFREHLLGHAPLLHGEFTDVDLIINPAAH